ncbi:hypothetical protein BC567DRAFT_265132 [Phyllosticta citribraziliensis]
MSEYFKRLSTARAETRPYRIPETPRSAPRTDHGPSQPTPRQRGRGRDRHFELGPSVPVGQSPRPSSLRIPRTPASNTLSSRLERYDFDEDTAVNTPLTPRRRTRRSKPFVESVTASPSYPKPRSSGRTAKPKKKQDPEERSYVPKTAEYEEHSDAIDGGALTSGRRTRSSDRKGRGRASNHGDDWPWPSVPVGQSPPPPWLRRPAPTAYTPAPPAKKSRKRKQDAAYRPDKASESDGDVIMISPPGKRRKVRKSAADVETRTTSRPKSSGSGRKGKGRTKPKPEELSYVPESPEDADERDAGPATSKTRGSGRKRKTKESDRSFVPTVETEDEDDDVVEGKITSRYTRSKSRSIPEDDDDDDDEEEQGDLDLATADNEAAWDNIINSSPFSRRVTPQQARLFRPSQVWATRPPSTPFARSMVLPDAQDDHDGSEQDDSQSVVDLASEDIDAAWDDVFSRSSPPNDGDGSDGDKQDDSQSVVDLASEDIDAAWDDVFSRSSPSHDTAGSEGDEQDDSQSVVDLASEDIDAAWDDVFSRSSNSKDSDEDDDDQDDSQSVVDLASEDVDAAWDDIISRTSPPRTRVAPWQPRGPRVYPPQTYRALGGGPLNRHFNMDLTLPDKDKGNKGASDVVIVINSPSSSSLSSYSDDEDADDADADGYHTAPTTPVPTNARKRKAAEAVDEEVTASRPKPARRGLLPKPIRVADLTKDNEATKSSPKSTRRRGRPSKTKAAPVTASGPKPARSGRQSKPENKKAVAPPAPSKRRQPSRLSHVEVGTTAPAAAPAQTPDAAGDAADSDAPSTRTRGAAKRRASAAPDAASAPKAKKQKQDKTQQKTQQKKPQPASATGTRRSTRSRKTT